MSRPNAARGAAVQRWLVRGVVGSAGALTLALPVALVRDDAVLLDVLMSQAPTVVFGLMLLTLVTATVRQRARRLPLAGLTVGLTLWVAGSAVLAAAGGGAPTSFPAPGEFLFLSAYLGLSAFVVLDGEQGSRTEASQGSLLDALIVVGGTACLAMLLVVAPAARTLPGDELHLLVGLMYPLLDIVLLLLLVGQVALGRRPARQAAALAVPLVLLCLADTSLVSDATGGTYTWGALQDVGWLWGFTGLVLAGVVERRDATQAAVADVAGEGRGGRASHEDAVGLVVACAGLVAVAALLVGGPSGLRRVVELPATVTLVVSGIRLVLALRQARRTAEALLLSRTDELTRLPNRRALLHRLGEAWERGQAVSLLLLDLDGFKEVNDTLGHHSGDATLRVIADRITAVMADGGFAVRLGGDEFAVLVAQTEEMRLLDLALRLRDTVRKPVRVDGLTVTIDVSIGIASRVAGLQESRDLLRRADIAMYQAKRRGGGAAVYDATTDDFSRERLRVADDLRRGLAAGEIVPWYQPKVHASTEAVSGLEALVRWHHPQEGLVSPGVFLPAARRAGLMPALTLAVLRAVVDDVRRWHATGLVVPVSVNVAPAELLSGAVLPQMLALVEGQLPPGSLVIEVTEDSFIADPDRARLVIERIRAAGMEVSIDDYGTGFSSLGYLRTLPVQELKIDRCFVADLLTDPRSEMIVRATHNLAAGLGLRTVAEGVEDAATADGLRAIGVDELQGFHFSRPLPPAEVEGWMLTHRDRLSAS